MRQKTDFSPGNCIGSVKISGAGGRIRQGEQRAREPFELLTVAIPAPIQSCDTSLRRFRRLCCRRNESRRPEALRHPLSKVLPFSTINRPANFIHFQCDRSFHIRCEIWKHRDVAYYRVRIIAVHRNYGVASVEPYQLSRRWLRAVFFK